MSSLLDGLPAAVAAAHARIAPHVLETPISRCRWRTDFELLLKCEHVQHTGSFKLRGALNRLLSLASEERSAGVIAASTGNHGQGIARAAELTGVAATVFVPATASPVKLAALREAGVALELVQGDGLAAEVAARRAARASGRCFVSPYNDALVIAGQGTVGLELASQAQHLDAVFVAVGGGGLVAGVAAVLKSRLPDVRVYGCWPANAPTLAQSLEAGRILTIEEGPTLSDGTAGGIEADSITFGLCQQLVDETVLVEEAEISAALRLLAERERWIVEGAAGVALAGCLKRAPELAGQSVAVILCGRNIDFARFLKATMPPAAG